MTNSERVLVPDCFCRLYASGRVRNKNSPARSCAEILNPEFKMGTLNPITFESGEFCCVNDFLLNPVISRTAIF